MVMAAAAQGVNEYDLLVIGGGINGVGIARDAAGRGLKVLLCERGDLAEGTSSRSSGLIHGGLRYLEHYEFRLVRESLIEREVLMGSAPHLIRPMRFVLPQDRSLRPAWFVRSGLFLYDHLGGRRRLPSTRSIDLHQSVEGEPLHEEFTQAFEYADCRVFDARLVITAALDAQARGAQIFTRTEFVGAHRVGARWQAQLRDVASGQAVQVQAAALVNAAGPWVGQVLAGLPQSASMQRMRLVKGSHIVVPKFWEGDHAYLVQNNDRRVVFVLPWEGDFAVIGTTEVAWRGDPASAEIDAAEVVYLCEAVGRWFRHPPRPAAVLHAWSGVRPLLEDEHEEASEVTRDYLLELDGEFRPDGLAPPINVFGGKLTTFRVLAEQVLERLAARFPGLPGPWTAQATLPGGDLPDGDLAGALAQWRTDHPWVPPALASRWWQAYGTRVDRMLGDAAGLHDLGQDFGAGLFQREVDYLCREEWASTAEDILWRRSHCGLHMTPAQRAALAQWLQRGA